MELNDKIILQIHLINYPQPVKTSVFDSWKDLENMDYTLWIWTCTIHCISEIRAYSKLRAPSGLQCPDNEVECI